MTTTPQQKTAAAKRRAAAPSQAMVKFGSRVWLLRNKLGLSQAEFAAKIQVVVNTVSRWERGAGHLPSPQSLAQIERLEQEHQTLVDARKKVVE